MLQMRHTAHELRVTLDHVLQGGETSMASQNNDNKTVPFMSEPEAEMSANHDIPEVWATAQLTAVELPFIREKRRNEF